jgi:beta-glucosidase
LKQVPRRSQELPQALAYVANVPRSSRVQLTAAAFFCVYTQYVGFIPANPRLGIPALRLEDGPSGVADTASGATKWPGGLHLAAMFDPSLVSAFGAAVAREHREKGVSVMLGPGVCLTRVPTGGRNWEYAGEDPFLAYTNVRALVQAVQREGVIACAKHFVDNNQEVCCR